MNTELLNELKIRARTMRGDIKAYTQADEYHTDPDTKQFWDCLHELNRALLNFSLKAESITDPQTPHLGRRVRIIAGQARVGGDKCPGRTGVVTGHYCDLALLYIDLETGTSGPALRETFWLEQLEFLDSTPEPSAKAG